MKNIFIVFPGKSSFVKQDIQILSRFGNVFTHHYRQGKSFRVHFHSQIRLLINLMFWNRRTDIYYCWFADYHSLLPALWAKLFSKPFYLVLGGYDVTYIPSIGYGSLKNPIRSFCARVSIRLATANLAVSRYVLNMGRNIVPEGKFRLVYNGVDPSKFGEITFSREPLILTVGIADTEQRIRLKGMDFFCKVAKELPKYKFLIIGVPDTAQKWLSPLPANVEVIHPLAPEELKGYYQRCRVYCQFSLIESFGMALVEAMGWGAIPVVCNTGALPELVNDVGVILSERTVTAAVKAIKKALNFPQEHAFKCRERIFTSFTVQDRERLLVDILGLSINRSTIT